MSKRNSILLLAAGFMPGMSFAATTTTTPSEPHTSYYSGQTFFTARPQFQSAMPEKIAGFHGAERSLARDSGWGGALEIVGFGGRTTSSSSTGLAQYFMYNNKTSLAVNLNQTVFPDVNPFNFGVYYTIATLPAGFASTLTFSPRQTTAGVGFDYKQYLGWNDGCPKRWWFEVSAPVVWVNNQMNLEETNIVTTGAALVANAAPNMATAFKGGQTAAPLGGVATSVFNFGKIDNDLTKEQKKTGVADVEIKIGYVYADEPTYHLEGYIGGVAPTGNKPKGEYVFEPIVGNNKHGGVMTGMSAGVEVWSGCNKDLRWEFEINSRYLFQNKQVRSFDLYNRPWSRYLLVYATAAEAAAPSVEFGINTFTQEVKVNPHFQHNYTMAFVYTHCGFQAEIGYNFWARQKETVKLENPFPTTVAVTNLDFTIQAAYQANVINKLSNIGNNNNSVIVPAVCVGGTTTVATTNLAVGGGEVTYTGNTITESDINLNSAASPTALTHNVYGALGYRADNWCWPVFANVGGSYEFSTNNAALNRWLVFGKIGVSI